MQKTAFCKTSLAFIIKFSVNSVEISTFLPNSAITREYFSEKEKTIKYILNRFTISKEAPAF